MTTVLPWVTLFVCLALTAARVPSAIRGENRAMFFLFAMISLDVLLSIEAPYLFIDERLGSFNVSNLLLRLLLYGTFLLVGVKVARAFGSTAGERAIQGPLGLIVLGITVVLTVCFFFSTETKGSSVGLIGLPWSLSLETYAALGRFYPGYVAASLVPGIWHAARGSGPKLLRTASAMLLLGFGLAIASQVFPLVPTSNTWLRPLINYSAALAGALGFGGIWLSKMLARRSSHAMASKQR